MDRMTPSASLDTWCKGIISKRTPDALRVLSYLLEAGIKYGRCSAVDIPEHAIFAEPNVIGGVFKLLPKCGFRKDLSTWVQPEAKRKHGRPVPVWRLQERWKADAMLKRLRGALLNTDPECPGQTMLVM